MLSKQQISPKNVLFGLDCDWFFRHVVRLKESTELQGTAVTDYTWNTLIIPADEYISIVLFHLKTYTIIKLHLMSEKCCLIIIIIERYLLWHT